jgi:hypothetical protein
MSPVLAHDRQRLSAGSPHDPIHRAGQAQAQEVTVTVTEAPNPRPVDGCVVQPWRV